MRMRCPRNGVNFRWLRLQADYDTEIARASLAKTLAKIKASKEAAEQTAEAN